MKWKRLNLPAAGVDHAGWGWRVARVRASAVAAAVATAQVAQVALNSNETAATRPATPRAEMSQASGVGMPAPPSSKAIGRFINDISTVAAAAR